MIRYLTRIAERLGGMTLHELTERLEPTELDVWLAEDYLRAEEERDRALEARAKAAARKAIRG